VRPIWPLSRGLKLDQCVVPEWATKLGAGLTLGKACQGPLSRRWARVIRRGWVLVVLVLGGALLLVVALLVVAALLVVVAVVAVVVFWRWGPRASAKVWALWWLFFGGW
jgi:hypothetical protein